MKAVQIVHCADLHLGSPLSGLGRRAAARRSDLIKTFEAILSLCRETSAQLLLIAGDLFDGVRPGEELLLAVRDGLASIPEVQVALAAGNHDPLTPDSPYLRQGFWPDNLHIFGAAMESVELPHVGVRLWGAGFAGPYARRPLLNGVGAPSDELLNLCVLHGELVGEGVASEYNPITRRQLADSGMDYVALGHVHAASGVQRAGICAYAYPGCPEGRGFDELGEKGGLAGTVGRGACDLSFHPLCRRQCLELSVEAGGLSGSREIAQRVREQMRGCMGEHFADHLYKIRLTGQVDETAIPAPETILAELGDIWFCKLHDDTEMAFRLDPVDNDRSLRGVFLRRMAERAEEEGDSPALRQAVKLGLAALGGKVDYYAD